MRTRRRRSLWSQIEGRESGGRSPMRLTDQPSHVWNVGVHGSLCIAELWFIRVTDSWRIYRYYYVTLWEYTNCVIDYSTTFHFVLKRIQSHLGRIALVFWFSNKQVSIISTPIMKIIIHVHCVIWTYSVFRTEQILLTYTFILVYWPSKKALGGNYQTVSSVTCVSRLCFVGQSKLWEYRIIVHTYTIKKE